MAQLQLLIELRCVVCDSVLVVNGIHADDEGCFACIEPCEECSKLTPRAADGAYCADCKRETVNDEYGWCGVCGSRRR